jgi:metallo-beta-lactamase family protein
LICESTYGDREHPPLDVFDQLCIVVNDAIARGGVMLVASFAVGRAQQLIYLLSVLMRQGRIPSIPIFLDSPMAASGMNIYRYYAAEHDLAEGLAVASDFEFNDDHMKLAARWASRDKSTRSKVRP